MRKVMIALLLATAQLCAAQTVYSVSGAALAYTPLAGGTDIPELVTTSEFEGPFALSATAELFGQSFAEFYVSRHGHIAFTDQPQPVQDGTLLVGNVVAAYWSTLEGGTGAGVQWLESGGELVVEWTNMRQSAAAAPKPTLTFQVRIDLASGAIGLRYAPATPDADTGLYRVLVAGALPQTAAQPVCIGEQATFVSNRGEVLVWPGDRAIMFTPQAGSAPGIAVEIGSNDIQQDMTFIGGDGWPMGILDLKITVSDGDNDAVSLQTTFAGEEDWELDEAQWQSTTAATPYTLEPGHGRVREETLVVTMLALEASGTAGVFRFRIRASNESDGGGTGDEGFGGSCTLGAAHGAWPLFFALLALVRRRRK